MDRARQRTDIPRLFVIGDQDNFTDLRTFHQQVQTFPDNGSTTSSQVVVVQNADHFFRGREREIMDIVGQWYQGVYSSKLLCTVK